MDVHPLYGGNRIPGSRGDSTGTETEKEKIRGKERKKERLTFGNRHPDQEAIRRLRNYVPPPSAYEQVPLTRRAAVLILLYADRNGNLRVVITMRAKTLSSCRSSVLTTAQHADPGLDAGEAALPGGTFGKPKQKQIPKSKLRGKEREKKEKKKKQQKSKAANPVYRDPKGESNSHFLNKSGNRSLTTDPSKQAEQTR